MNSVWKFIRRWGPASVVLIAIVVAVTLYAQTLRAWFTPLVEPITRPYIESRHDGAIARLLETLLASDHAIGTDTAVPVGPFRVSAVFDPEVAPNGTRRVRLRIADVDGLPLEGAAVRTHADGSAAREVGPGVYETTLDPSETEITADVRTADQRHADVRLTVRPGGAGLTVASAGPASGSDIAYWTCTMHPSVKSQTPGKCPICSMDLVPVTRDEVESGMIFVDAQRRQLIGVKTDIARKTRLERSIRAVGRVTYNETTLADVTLKFRAWIGKVHADYTGKPVRAGEPLFTLYSPELWTAQDEFLQALRQAKDNPARGERMVDAARTKLRLWGLGDAQIDAIARQSRSQEYVTYLAPASGVVVEKHVFDGSAVEAGQLLYRIADLSTVWIEADVYEFELPFIESGRKADITLSYLPDRRFEGTVSYLYPFLNPETRTGRVRIEAPNTEGALKPEMYANVDFQVPLGERLVVPESAVIYAGNTRVAFVDHGEGRLEPRIIRTGVRSGDLIEVLEGLNEGDVVVASANFLIAAESKLKAGIDKW